MEASVSGDVEADVILGVQQRLLHPLVTDRPIRESRDQDAMDWTM